MIQATSLLKALLRAIAEFDGVPFDPKKYPYQTALSGETGKILTPCVDALLALSLIHICLCAVEHGFIGISIFGKAGWENMQI